MPQIQIIGVPMDLGADRRGVDMGPSAIRYGDITDTANFKSKLENLGYTCHDQGDIPVLTPETRNPTAGTMETASAHQAKYLPEVEDVCDNVSSAVSAALADGQFPLILGGDHSIAIGSLNGTSQTANVGVIWFDAHADLNTPETTPSGNVHGMPLAAVLGIGAFQEPEFEWARAPNVRAENIAIVGLRSVDDAEKDVIRDSDITAYSMSDIDERGIAAVVSEALEIVTKNTEQLHVSFDLDWLDPVEAPGVGTPVSGGVSYREAHYALESIARYHEQMPVLRSLEFVEVNPILDKRNKTAALTGELLQAP